MMETVEHREGIAFITCKVCYCAVVERFWDKHVDYHQARNEHPNA